VLFEHDHIHAGAREQESQHYAGRASAHDAAGSPLGENTRSLGQFVTLIQDRKALHHRTASLRARAASSNTFFHAHERFAVMGADFADLNAEGTGLAVELALMGHQFGGQLADSDTIHHQAEMLRLGMFSAHLNAMRHCRPEAYLVAAQALFDAALHLLAKLMHDLLLSLAPM